MWYAPIEPYASGLLDASGGHRLYWETSGNPNGIPVLYLHGGPGAGCTPNSRRWFDPRRYRIVAFDQRGCGRSLPHACIEQNTTEDLLNDIEALRRHLDVERWALMGRSWGSALALAYAERQPDRVSAMILSAIFTARRSELDWIYRSADLIAAYHAQLTCGDPDVETAAARAWCEWEHALVRVPVPLSDDPATMHARARIESHYFLHGAFLEEGQLLANAYRLCGIPGRIVQGADDLMTPPSTAIELHRAWSESKLTLVPAAGHSSSDPHIMRALINATDTLVAVL